MQKFKMLKTVRGVHDGHLHPTDFHKNTIHEIGDNLADQFIELGVVEMVDESDGDPAATASTEEKSQGDAPSNKAKAAAPANKSK